jgi:hypothetical protein
MTTLFYSGEDRKGQVNKNTTLKDAQSSFTGILQQPRGVYSNSVRNASEGRKWLPPGCTGLHPARLELALLVTSSASGFGA